MLPIYAAAFERAQGAAQAGQDLQSLFKHELATASTPGEAMATLLAITDARRGQPKRGKASVCDALFTFCRCDRRHRA